MKKMMLKIRHKLIRWLGGYTEQYSAPVQRHYVQKYVGVISLQDDASFPKEMMDNPEYQKRMMEQIAHRIAVQMLNTGLICFTETDEPYVRHCVMHGCAKVLDPHKWVMFERRAENGD